MTTIEKCGENCDCYYCILTIDKPSPTDQGPNRNHVKQQYRKLLSLVNYDETDDDLAHSVSTLLYQAQVVLSDTIKERQYRLHGLFSSNYVHNKAEIRSAVRFLTDKLLKLNSDDTNYDRSCNVLLVEGKEKFINNIEEPSSSFSFSLADTNEPTSGSFDHNIQADNNLSYSSEIEHNSANEAQPLVQEISSTLNFKQRKIGDIKDHNIRPKKVWFIVKWMDNSSLERIEAKFLVENHENELLNYLESLRRLSPRRFNFLMNREPILSQLLHKQTNCI